MKPEARPWWVMVFGGFWIILGVVGIVCFFKCAWPFRNAIGLWWYPLFTVGMVFGAAMILSAAYFVVGRPRARFGLELVCWSGLLAGVVAEGFIYAAQRTLLNYELPETDQLASSLKVGGIGTVIGFAIYAVSIWFLRSKPVRAVFCGQQLGQREA